MILHYFNTDYKLNRKNEFRVWQRSVNLPTRGTNIFGLAIIARDKGLDVRVVVEDPRYKFPEYRIRGYKLREIEMAAYASELYYKRSKRLGVHVEERKFNLAEVKRLLKEGRILMLRLNMALFRKGKLDKRTTNHFPVFEYKNKRFLIGDPLKGLKYIDEKVMEEAFKGVKKISNKDSRMIILS